MFKDIGHKGDEVKTDLDCIPCLLRQTIEAVRMVSSNPDVHERIVREILHEVGGMDLDDSPAVIVQRIHQRLRKMMKVDDPYRALKDNSNRMVLDLLPKLKAEIESVADPLSVAVRLAIAGNVIDMGASGNITKTDLYGAISQALKEPFDAEMEDFRKCLQGVRNILYLADNAGEIVFDRLLIEELGPERITLAVRGRPVINDATMVDAQVAGLGKTIKIIDNGSDAPGTLLAECSLEFRNNFKNADLIIAKGQGNYETLNSEQRNIYFLFKVKCVVVSRQTGLPVGTHVLLHARTLHIKQGDRTGLADFQDGPGS